MYKINVINSGHQLNVNVGSSTCELVVMTRTLPTLEEILKLEKELKLQAKLVRLKGIKVTLKGLPKAIVTLKEIYNDAANEVNELNEFYSKCVELTKPLQEEIYCSEKHNFLKVLSKEFQKDLNQYFYSGSRSSKVLSLTRQIKSSIEDLKFTTTKTISTSINFRI